MEFVKLVHERGAGVRETAYYRSVRTALVFVAQYVADHLLEVVTCDCEIRAELCNGSGSVVKFDLLARAELTTAGLKMGLRSESTCPSSADFYRKIQDELSVISGYDREWSPDFTVCRLWDAGYQTDGPASKEFTLNLNFPEKEMMTIFPGRARGRFPASDEWT